MRADVKLDGKGGVEFVYLQGEDERSPPVILDWTSAEGWWAAFLQDVILEMAKEVPEGDLERLNQKLRVDYLILKANRERAGVLRHQLTQATRRAEAFRKQSSDRAEANRALNSHVDSLERKVAQNYVTIVKAEPELVEVEQPNLYLRAFLVFSVILVWGTSLLLTGIAVAVGLAQ